MDQMKKLRERRWRSWADKQIQGQLVARVAVYWIACQLATIVTIIGMNFLTQGSPTTGSGTVWNLVVPAAIVSGMVMPFALFDVVVFSNRFAGPMMRFRRQLARLANEGTAEEIQFRNKDFYGDLAENFNQLTQKLDKAEPSKSHERVAPRCLPTLHTPTPMGSEHHV